MSDAAGRRAAEWAYEWLNGKESLEELLERFAIHSIAVWRREHEAETLDAALAQATESLKVDLRHQCEANNRNWQYREQQAEEIARWKREYNDMMVRYEGQSAEQTQQIHADAEEIARLREAERHLATALAEARREERAVCIEIAVGVANRYPSWAEDHQIGALDVAAALRAAEAPHDDEGVTG